MKEDNNPFRPTLAKPVDDSVLANDPAADNFLAGNDQLAKHIGKTMDGIKGSGDSLLSHNNATASRGLNSSMPRLDQMSNSSASNTNHNGAPNGMVLGDPIAHMDISDFSGVKSPSNTNDNNAVSTTSDDHNDILNALSEPATTPAVTTLSAPIESGKPTKSGKKTKERKHLLGRKKKKQATATTAPVNADMDKKHAAESVFGSSLTAAADATAPSSTSPTLHALDQLDHQTSHSTASSTNFDPLDPTSSAMGSLDNIHDSKAATDLLDSLANDNGASGHDSTTTSPIGASLATAAATADSKPSGVNMAATKAGKTKSGQPKQLTISVLTIIFFILFLGATAAAVCFAIQNNKNSNSLSDAQAELQQLKDQAADSSNSSNVASTQLDSLQSRIADLTKQNEEKQATIDQNNKTIQDLNNKNNDLSSQLKQTQDKLNSDTQVSQDLQSLVVTMCTQEPYKSTSSACISANGGNATPAPAQSPASN